MNETQFSISHTNSEKIKPNTFRHLTSRVMLLIMITCLLEALSQINGKPFLSFHLFSRDKGPEPWSNFLNLMERFCLKFIRHFRFLTILVHNKFPLKFKTDIFLYTLTYKSSDGPCGLHEPWTAGNVVPWAGTFKISVLVCVAAFCHGYLTALTWRSSFSARFCPLFQRTQCHLKARHTAV